MTYEEIVSAVRHTYENADARAIWNHIAIQVNIIGEGSGIFYVEIAERAVTVEPYDYYDRDGLVTASGDVILAIAHGETTFKEEYEKGTVRLEGNMEKLQELKKLKVDGLTAGEKVQAKKAKVKKASEDTREKSGTNDMKEKSAADKEKAVSKKTNKASAKTVSKK